MKRYSTPEGSLPVVAVMVTEEVPPADGAEANDAGLGVGGVVSPLPLVVAEAATDGAVVFWLALCPA